MIASFYYFYRRKIKKKQKGLADDDFEVVEQGIDFGLGKFGFGKGIVAGVDGVVEAGGEVGLREIAACKIGVFDRALGKGGAFKRHIGKIAGVE